MVKAVCFDLFSTLVSVAHVPLEVGEFTADILGVSHTAWRDICFSDAHEICRATDHQQVIQTLAYRLDPTIPSEKIQAATTARQKRFDYALQHGIAQQVLETLSDLRRTGYTLGLISNASTAEVAAWRDSPIAEYFDHAVFSCDCGLKKPDTAIYQHTCDLLGVEPDACIYIGDGGSHEFTGAAAVGMTVIMTSHYLDETLRAQRLGQFAPVITAEVQNFRQLIPLIERINQRQ